MKKNHWIWIAVLLTMLACRKNPEPTVVFETTAGTLKVKLYKETPMHRDNFVKLVEAGFYDSLLFYHVVPDFLVETGDPNSKTANRNRLLGVNDADYTLSAEIDYPAHFHKKGALSAARLPDAENPDRASSGSRFCIIVGRVFTNAELDTLETEAYNKRWDYVLNRAIILNREKIAAQRNNRAKLQVLEDNILTEATEEMKKDSAFAFTPAQRKAYTTLGGMPQLDGDYTVFGEVVEGLHLLNSLSHQPTDHSARPLKDWRILRAWVE